MLPLSIEKLSLFQFKNYHQQSYRFNERVVGICGRNGVGKTNLLDAVHYLCFTRSYFTRSDQLHVHHGTEGFRLEGGFTLNGNTETAVCILRESGKKEFLLDGTAYKKFSEHIGRYPCVVIAPDDVQLITGSSEVRRGFLDTLLSQLDSAYLRSLIIYTKVLQQRNSFLKAYRDSFHKDLSVLDVLDEQLATEAALIYEKRSVFLQRFLPVVKQLYHDISQTSENINLLYESELQQMKMEELLRLNRQKDLMVQRTTGGIHRDDLLPELDGVPFKSIASQGQRKSLLFALKLAEVEIIHEEKNIYPILLLDDVFEKLDESRITNLLQRVVENEAMQIFITDTNCERLEQKLTELNQPFQMVRPGNS
ncbi:MAG: DNA replication/repair protein RecF [Flavisolibacter sp.]